MARLLQRFFLQRGGRGRGNVLHQNGEAVGVHLGVLAEGLGRDQPGRPVHDDVRHLGGAGAAVVQHVALRPDDLHPALREGVALPAQVGQLAQHRAHPAFGGFPVEVGPVEGVPVALHGNFVAVIDAGHAGQGEDHGVGQPQQPHAVVVPVPGQGAAALPVAVLAVRGFVCNGGERPLGVVGAHEVHQAVQRRGRVMLADGHDVLGGVRRAAALQKAQHRVAEGVVHHRVQPLAQKVGAAHAVGLFGGGVLPHLAQQVAVRPVGLHRLADLFNEIVRQLVGHVQPEAGRTQGQPGVDHAAGAADELPVARVAFLHLGQALEAPPAAVAAGVVGAEVEPAPVGALGVVVGAARAVAALPVEVDGIRAGVAEHAVQNDADALPAGRGAQLAEFLLCAQQRIRVQVVGGVVTVVGMGLKDGVQVDPADSQLL